jgi:putative ABC transport system permease protein
MFFMKTPTTNEDVLICVMSTDENFLNTLQIEWAEKPETNHFINNYLVNETGVKKLKLTDKVIGQKLNLGSARDEIAGVVKDFNYVSLREKLDGLLIGINPDTASSVIANGGSLYIRLDPKVQLTDKIKAIEQLYKKYEPESPFEYYFLDDAFDKLYKGEDRLARIFSAFTGIAIVIACLGLLGLVTFTAELKTKEIGIRKILGATVRSIVLLLSRDFFLLLLISMVIATPLAWYVMNNWLSGFSYRTEIPLEFFIMAGFSAIAVALITISWQALKAAWNNPVNSLRNE